MELTRGRYSDDVQNADNDKDDDGDDHSEHDSDDDGCCKLSFQTMMMMIAS